MNILATFQNDPWKFTDVRALTVIFHVRSWKRQKKIAKIFFGRLWQNPELILINMFRPTYVQNLVTLAWKMSSGMSKEAGSLNGPLCAYLMRQNLHDQTCVSLRVINVLTKFENDPWKIVDVRVLTELVCPAARPPARVMTIPRSPWGLKVFWAPVLRTSGSWNLPVQMEGSLVRNFNSYYVLLIHVFDGCSNRFDPCDHFNLVCCYLSPGLIFNKMSCWKISQILKPIWLDVKMLIPLFKKKSISAAEMPVKFQTNWKTRRGLAKNCERTCDIESAPRPVECSANSSLIVLD